MLVSLDGQGLFGLVIDPSFKSVRLTLLHLHRDWLRSAIIPGVWNGWIKLSVHESLVDVDWAAGDLKCSAWPSEHLDVRASSH